MGTHFAAGGLTGCGKTTILHRMHEEGYQVLDLEVTMTCATVTTIFIVITILTIT